MHRGRKLSGELIGYLEDIKNQYSLNGSIDLIDSRLEDASSSWISLLMTNHAKSMHFVKEHTMHLSYRLDENFCIYIQTPSAEVSLGILKSIARKIGQNLSDSRLLKAA